MALLLRVCAARRLVIQGHFGRAGEARKAQEERYKLELRKFRKQQAKAADKAAAAGKPAPLPKKPPRAPHKAAAEEMDARMLGALITGVRRAFPYVAAEQVGLRYPYVAAEQVR